MAEAAHNQNACRIAILSRPHDFKELGEVFEQVLQMHPTDAMLAARRAPGVMSESLSTDQANALAAALGRIGLCVRVLAPDQVPDLHVARVVHHLRCLDAGLQIMELHGWPALVVPWAALQMVCVGEVPQEKSRHYVEEKAVTAGHHHVQPTPTDFPLSPGPAAWITCRSPFPALRVDHLMNYEYLGPRMSDSATANFRLFVDDVIAHAPGVFLTDSTLAFVEHGSLLAYRFASSDDLQHYATWQSLLAPGALPAGQPGMGTEPTIHNAVEQVGRVIHHCQKCGKVVERHLHEETPVCCGVPMVSAVVEPDVSSPRGSK